MNLKGFFAQAKDYAAGTVLAAYAIALFVQVAVQYGAA